MVTPGLEKYRLTYTEPFRTVMQCSEAALDSARAYLCIGYGFNDEHVQAKLVARCETHDVPLLIVTQELTNGSRRFLQNGRCRKYLALERSGYRTRAYSHNCPEGMEFERADLWQLKGFLDFTLGETS